MSRLYHLAPMIVLCTALAALFHRLALGEVIFWGTPALQFYPWREMAFGMLRAGRLPLWNPLLGNGAPLLANYQTAVFYPPNWLYLFIPTEYAMGLVGMLHLAWAGAGMVVYARRMGQGMLGQGVAAIAYALSGYLVARFGFLSITSAAPWLPWLLWAVEGVVLEQEGPAWGVIALAGVVAMLLLAGHAQTAFYSLLFAGAYALFRATPGKAARMPRLGLALIGVLLGAGLAAAQLAPTLELMLNSHRAGGVDESLALTYSLWPLQFLTLVAPNLYGSPATGDYMGYGAYWEDAIYVGLMTIVMSGHALARWWLQRRELAAPPAVRVVPFFALALPPIFLLALGDNTPIFPWLFRHVLTFDLFQAPTRWSLLAVFSLAFLGGTGADGWQTGERGMFWTRLLTAGGISFFIAALAATRLLGEVETTLLRGVMRLGATIIALGALTLLQPEPDHRLRPAWEIGALILLACDLVIAHWGLNPTVDPDFYHHRAALADELAPLVGGHRTLYPPQDEYNAKYGLYLGFEDFDPRTMRQRLAMRDSLIPNQGMLDGVSAVNNFDPLRIGWSDALFESLREEPTETLITRARAMNVGVILTTSPLAGHEAVARAGGVRAYAVPDPLPRAYLVGGAWTAEDWAGAIEQMRHDDFDPERVAVVEGDVALPNPSDRMAPGRVTGLQADSTTTTIVVNARKSALLILTDTWYPGWHAALDGEPVEMLRANVAFRAIRVPSGRHVVVFTYRPVSVRVGVGMSGLALIVLGGLWLWRRDRSGFEGTMADREWPFVSVIMPIRNEADFIEESLGAVLAQDYSGQLEALVVDGMSDDGTRQIVQTIATEDQRVRLLDNPRRIVPTAMNLGAQAARGEIVVRVDGRSIIPPNYVRRCVESLHQTGAWNVGGMQIPVARTPVGQVIVAAMASPFGAGPAKFRFATQPQPVDTVYLGAWPRDVFLRVGGFDERFVRNQDYEFNIRLRQAGGTIYFAPDLRVDYYGRETLRGLWQQYLQYGIWKARVIKMHPASFRPRQSAAPVLVAGLVFGPTLALLGPLWGWVYLTGVAIYLVAVITFSVSQAVRQGLRMWWMMPIVFLTLHLAWGLGFWAGVWRWWIRGQGSPQPKRT